MAARSGILLVVSGPSGSGKTTLCRQAAAAGEAYYAVSCTTRLPRRGEVEGIHYHFLTTEEFARRDVAGDFLECAVVHGNRYGTLRSEVTEHLANGRDVVMDLDVQGAASVRACEDPAIRLALVDLFVMPGDASELRLRLAGRGTDDDATIDLRMHNALEEMQQWDQYTYRLVSGDRDRDYQAFTSLLETERMRVARFS